MLVKNLKKASGRTFLVAFLTASGMFASAGQGLAAEPGPAVPLTAANPAAPAPGDDPDDEPGGSGGWSGGKDSEPSTKKTSDEPADAPSGDPQPIEDDADESSGGTREPDDGDESDPDAGSDHFGSKEQTKAEKAAAAKASQKAKAAQQKAQKKAAASKKSSAKKKADAKKKQAAAKKMKQQAMKAAKRAAARAAAEKAAKQRAEAQRRATADDDRDSEDRSGGSISSLRQGILDLTNKARRSAGCGTVRYSTQLEKSAQSHANDMSQHHYMSHQSRSGKNSDQRIRATGFDGDKTGENLGEGFSSPDAVFKAWMNSPSHRRNILDCGFRILGVGYNGGYWAQHFGG